MKTGAESKSYVMCYLPFTSYCEVVASQYFALLWPQMNLNVEIARRYLVGKKSTNAINYITWMSVLGIAIGTAALILILSVFNGFQTFISSMYNSFNPDLKVVTYEGKYFQVDSVAMVEIRALPGVVAVSEIIQEVAIFDYKDIQKPGIIKGVDTHYKAVTGMDSTLTRGRYLLDEGTVNYGLVGRVMSVNLSINPSDKLTPLTVYMPLRERKGLMSAMGKNFKSLPLYPSGVFTVGGDADAQYVLASRKFVARLLDKDDEVSSLEIKLDASADEKSIRASIDRLTGGTLLIKNRYEQDATFLKIMNIEKWISYAIATLILLIIAFNMVGSLWMMVLEKRKDIAILRSMGYDTNRIRSIFIWEGMLITIAGVVIGIVVALALYVAQKQYGIVGIPDGFMIDAYPIEIRLTDFVIIVVTVLSIGALASLLPALRAGQVGANVRSE